MLGKRNLLTNINKKIDKLSLNIEKMKLADYVYYLEHPRKLLIANFIGGLARGVGIAVGFTFLGALIIYLLQIVVKWNLPLIGAFISEIIEIVEENMSKTGGRVGG